jgi:hypothetical protein
VSDSEYVGLTDTQQQACEHAVGAPFAEFARRARTKSNLFVTSPRAAELYELENGRVFLRKLSRELGKLLRELGKLLNTFETGGTTSPGKT